MHSTAKTINNDQIVNGYHQELVKPQLLMLTLSGLLPPKSWSSSRWKSIMYDVYTFLSFIFHIPFFLFQIMGVYVFWGNLQIVTGIIFQMTVCFDGLVILVYFTYHRKYLVKIIEMLGTKFVPYLRKVGSSKKQDDIMREAIKFSNTMTKILMIIFVVVMSAWCVFPFFVKYWSHEQEAEIANYTNVRVHFEYFVIATWLPDNAFTSPMYEIIYACQFFYIWSIVANFTVGNMVFSSIFYGISIQFQLLATSIRDIDDICTDLNAEFKNKEDMRSDRTHLASDISDKEAYDRYPLRGTFQSSTDTFQLKFLNDEAFAGAYEICCKDITDSAHWNDVTTDTNTCSETAYMIECINYHQCLLKFCDEVDDFLSPLLLIYIVMYEAMICVPLYQLVMGEADNMFRFFTSAVDATFLPLTICLSGEMLSTQSMAVRKAAYECRWYHRSQSLKKLLQMILIRTKEPVKMTAGKFFVISLETFANIANKVFAYFTVLKNMQP